MPAFRPGALWLHFRRFLTSPLLLASLIPSSRHLARLVARHVDCPPDRYVLEIGAGTGTITEGLIESGIPAERIVAVEIDPELAAYLREAMPGLVVVEGDIFDLADSLPTDIVERIGTVICGIPGSLLPQDRQRRLVDLIFSLLRNGQSFLAYSHRLGSPLPQDSLGLSGTRLGRTFVNLPMASVWSYRRAGTTPATSG